MQGKVRRFARRIAALSLFALVIVSPVSARDPALAQKGGTKALGDPDRDLVYVPVTACRILDTRIAGGPIAAGGMRDFDLADVVRFSSQGGDTGNCGVGDKGSFAAAAINFTVVSPSMAGYITVFPYLASRPNAATINYVAGDARNGFTIVRLDQSAAVPEFSVYSFAQTHLVADIVGYFINPPRTTPQLYGTYWATSNGRSSCSSVCTDTAGAAVASSTGKVCIGADGSSHIYENYVPPQTSGYGSYRCGDRSQTAQCSCMRNP